MERPLHPSARNRNDALVLARALLYAEQTVAAHRAVLEAALHPVPPAGPVQRLAGRTLAWTALRPQPRARVIAGQLRGDDLLRELLEKHALHPPPLLAAPCMRRWPGAEALPRLATVGDLADWLRVDVPFLQWMADTGDRNNRSGEPRLQHYSRRVVVKRDGAVRLLEAPKQHLKHMQRQIAREILALVPLHPAVHGFCKGRSVVSFAAPHAGKDAVLRLDLQDFFPAISGPRVQALWRTLGYPEHVADLLGALCTATVPRGFWRARPEEVGTDEWERARLLYARPHLPQGAPTSPAVANLCAFRLDRRLAALAEASGCTYTRYADDLAFSGAGAFGRLALRVAAIADEEGFRVQHRKTKVMRQSQRQQLAGITVNVRPSLPRSAVDSLKATLVNCVRHGPASQNREGHANFRAFLAGAVAYVAMVQPARGARLREIFERILWA